MAAGDVRNIFRIPGRLSFGASNLATAYPHGGTAMGIIGSKVLRPFSGRYIVTAEELGAEPIEEIKTGFAWVLAATLREFDNDVIANVFPDTFIGASTQRVIEHPGPPDGSPLSSERALSNLVFTPDDQANHVGFIMYRAIPEIDEAAELSFSLAENQEIAVLFSGIRDATSRVIQIGLLSDLSL